jgi:hypothetical protein
MSSGLHVSLTRYAGSPTLFYANASSTLPDARHDRHPNARTMLPVRSL